MSRRAGASVVAGWRVRGLGGGFAGEAAAGGEPGSRADNVHGHETSSAVGGSGMHEEPDYDFFIAHAGTDEAEAVNFYELLAHETEVFLDARCLLPGDSWTIVIPRAQRRSRVTLVLISDRTEQAFYEGEEIANAIAMAREKGSTHRVVPIYLAGRPPEDVPYGLRQKQALAVTDGMSVEQIAKELLDLHRILTADDPTRRTEVPRAPELSGNSVRDLVDKVLAAIPSTACQPRPNSRRGAAMPFLTSLPGWRTLTR